MLHEFIVLNREEIIRRCREKVAARSITPPEGALVDRGVPMFLDQLGHALSHGLHSSIEAGNGATQHGRDLLDQGFSVS